MGQFNYKKQNPENAIDGEHIAFGIDTLGRAYLSDNAGNITYFSNAIESIIANLGVGLEDDLPNIEDVSVGDIYVTNDSFSIYTKQDEVSWSVIELVKSQIISDTLARKLYVYTGIALQNLSNQWVMQIVTEDVTEMQPYVIYLVDGTSAPVSLTMPAYANNSTDEYRCVLYRNTHKATVINDGVSYIIPSEGESLLFKGNGVGEYILVNDNRHMARYYELTEDRDFSDGDGFENHYTYNAYPATSTDEIVFTLPAPKTFDRNGAVIATFGLGSAGTLRIVRSDGGYIGTSTVQIISTVGASIAIMETEGEYHLTQDSRPKAIADISFPFYRADDDSDETGFKALVRSKDDVRYGAEELLLSPLVTSTSFVNYVSYMADLSAISTLYKSRITFLTNNRIYSAAASNILVKYELVRWVSDVEEYSIATTAEFEVSSLSFTQFLVNLEIDADVEFGTDRLVLRVWIARAETGGTSPQLETKIEGDNGAYFVENVPSTQVKHNDMDGRSELNAHPISSITGLQDELDDKQDSLTSGDNIKTVGGKSIVGSGDVDEVTLKDASFLSEYNNNSLSGSQTLDWNNGQNQKVTLTGDIDITFTPITGAGTFRTQMKFIQDSTGGRNVTFTDIVENPSEFDFSSGGADQVCIATFYYDGERYWLLSTSYITLTT